MANARVIALVSSIVACYVTAVAGLVLATVYGVENRREINRLRELIEQ